MITPDHTSMKNARQPPSAGASMVTVNVVALTAVDGVVYQKTGWMQSPETSIVGHGFWPVIRRQSRRSVWIVSAYHTLTCGNRK